ncbi:MAG TPA: transcriptional repressor [Candidatus Cottocaccamicrobium excrementipullorum]|nr:transcriptional repressor [Candidatus Cottocaccamicrobium excrementipullorum]
MWQKEQVIRELKRRGKRMTKQRLLLLDIILDGRYSCGKEIYYDAIKVDPTIGLATVYRMLATLEEIGIVSRCYQCSLEQDSCVFENAEAG